MLHRIYSRIQGRLALPDSRRGSSRFTLIEMLVVIAIIGILAALLMPTLRNAVESGKQMSCLNNLKAMTRAGIMYADSYDGVYLPAQTLGSTGGVAWNALEDFRRLMQFPTGTTPHWNMWPVGALCPMADYAHIATTNNAMYSYGMCLSELQPLFAANAPCKAYRLSSVTSPSKRLVFIDAFDWIVGFNSDNIPGSANGYWAYLENKTAGRPSCQTAFRHGGITSANVAFFDGHAEMLNWTKLSTVPDLSIWRAYH